MHAARSICADELVAQLDALAARRGRTPRFLRSDNGTELTSHALRDGCRFSTTESAFIDPGAPWQNPFVESFHARARRTAHVKQFAFLAEARVVIGDWHQHYNQRRPHSSNASVCAPLRQLRDQHHRGASRPCVKRERVRSASPFRVVSENSWAGR